MIFFKRSRNKLPPVQESRLEAKQYTITMSGRNLRDLFNCTAALKVWLPESVETQLNEVSLFLNVSVSDLIRQILFIHLYGRYDFLGYVERSLHYFKDPQSVVNDVMFSLADDAPPKKKRSLFGKKQEPVPAPAPKPVPAPEPPKEKQVAATKIFLPERMKQDLLAMSEKRLIPVSEYCRLVLKSHLMGQYGSLPESPIKDEEGFE
jgi:hypothetical protein